MLKWRNAISRFFGLEVVRRNEIRRLREARIGSVSGVLGPGPTRDVMTSPRGRPEAGTSGVFSVFTNRTNG
jgi:hypothetical protein